VSQNQAGASLTPDLMRGRSQPQTGNGEHAGESLAPGPIVLMGSGETAPGSQRIYTWLMQRLAAPVRVAILETPAGFQPNSALVAGEIAAYIERRLVNFRPAVTPVPARARGTAFSPDDEMILEPMRHSNLLLLGPGSPTYAVRQLAASHAWEWMQARQRLGAGLLLSSAGTLAAGVWTMPVYEIYKAGADLHWVPGLDLFATFGLRLLLVSHWNNNDGGASLDTSRCYIGNERFERLRALLPADERIGETLTLVGIDEQTALCIDVAAGKADVIGVGGVTIERGGRVWRVERGGSLSMADLGAWRLPSGSEGIRPSIWQAALDDAAAASAQADAPPRTEPPAEVLALLAQRQEARRSGAWSEADRLRDAISALGWRIQDTPGGPQLEPSHDQSATRRPVTGSVTGA